MEHGDRLVQAPVTIGVGEEGVGQVAEVLGMDPVVAVEVGHEDIGRVELEADQLAVQPAPAVGHRRALADHDPRLQRVEDVEEVEEPVAEQLTEPSHVLPSGVVGLAGDDRDHDPVAGVVGLGQGADRLVQLLERLGVGRHERDVEQSSGIRQRLAPPGKDPGELAPLAIEPSELAPPTDDGEALTRSLELVDPGPDQGHQPIDLGQAADRVGQGQGPGPPVLGHRPADPREGDAHAAGQQDRLVEPVEVEAQDEPGHDLREAKREDQGTHDQRPADEARDDLEAPLDEPGAGRIARVIEGAARQRGR